MLLLVARCVGMRARVYTATHCNTLQHPATHATAHRPAPPSCRAHERDYLHSDPPYCMGQHYPNTHCNSLQLTETHCNSLQLTATHCNSLQHIATHFYISILLVPRRTQVNTLQLTATHYNSLQTYCYTHTYASFLQGPRRAQVRTSTHCNSLQLITTRCNILPHTHLCPVSAGPTKGTSAALFPYAEWDSSTQALTLRCGKYLFRICIALVGSVLQCVAVCCSVLQCVAVCVASHRQVLSRIFSCVFHSPHQYVCHDSSICVP